MVFGGSGSFGKTLKLVMIQTYDIRRLARADYAKFKRNSLDTGFIYCEGLFVFGLYGVGCVLLVRIEKSFFLAG